MDVNHLMGFIKNILRYSYLPGFLVPVPLVAECCVLTLTQNQTQSRSALLVKYRTCLMFHSDKMHFQEGQRRKRTFLRGERGGHPRCGSSPGTS